MPLAAEIARDDEPVPPAPGVRTPVERPAPAAPVRPLVSLRVLVPTIAVVLLTVAVLGAALILERNARSILRRELETRLVLEARNLATTSAGALLGEFPELTLHPIARTIAGERPELALVAVVDHRGVVQGHPDARALGGAYEAPPDLRPATSAIPLAADERLLENAEVLVAMAPVSQGAGGRLGVAVVGMRQAYFENALASARRQQSWLLLAVLAFGAISTFVLMTVLLRPVAVLRQGLERIGRGDLDTPLATRDRTELGVLAGAVNRMAAELKVAQREAIEKERLAGELELARRIQRSLLPQGVVATADFELEGFQRAAAEVGGDYYDVLTLRDGRIGVAIADVSGKGLAGCLVTSMLSALLRALRDAHPSPAKLLVALEDTLALSLPRGSFVTMFYAVLDPATGRMTLASAGHTPMLVVRAGGAIEWRRARATPLGAVRGALARTLRDEELELAPGDLALHFTDGFSEAPHAVSGEQFGHDRIGAVVAEHAAAGPRAVIDALRATVEGWTGPGTPTDDETMLVVARRAAVPAGLSTANTLSAGRHPASAWHDEARRRGHGLEMHARLEELVHLRGWIEAAPDLGGLAERSRRQLESALYEVCANVVEHGYGLDPDRTLRLWWVPSTAVAPAGAPPDPVARVREGWLLIQDYGAAFRPSDGARLDFGDPTVRRKGRGLGLDMVRRIMREIDHHPGTPDGNFTRLVFDPTRAGTLQEANDE